MILLQKVNIPKTSPIFSGKSKLGNLDGVAARLENGFSQWNKNKKSLCLCGFV